MTNDETASSGMKSSNTTALLLPRHVPAMENHCLKKGSATIERYCFKDKNQAIEYEQQEHRPRLQAFQRLLVADASRASDACTHDWRGFALASVHRHLANGSLGYWAACFAMLLHLVELCPPGTTLLIPTSKSDQNNSACVFTGGGRPSFL
jgi:hypothetical protein